jgi:hypothetical protein
MIPQDSLSAVGQVEQMSVNGRQKNGFVLPTNDLQRVVTRRVR